MFIYSSYCGYGRSSEKRPFCKNFVKKNTVPKKTVVKERPIISEVPSNIEVSTSSDVDYYASLNRLLTSRFHVDYRNAMVYAKMHPEAVETVNTTGR